MNIQIVHICKSFGDQKVLDDISFIINNKDRIGLVGNNGSGKSTIFNIIAEEEYADSGSIIFNPKKIRIGYLQQIIKDDRDFLSSGEKIKKRLAEILKNNPDVLLLDEPTNHLDWKGISYLESAINRFRGPILLVSHDRWFLDKTINKILELENGKIKVYGGNYSFYKKQKQVEVDANLKKYIEQEKRIGRLKKRANIMKNRTQQLEFNTTGADFYVRKKAAKSASAAINIERKIAKELSTTKIEKPKVVNELQVLFRPTINGSQTVVYVKNISKSFGEKIIFKNTFLTIEKGDRIALIGNNGSGKSVLLKLILNEINPDSGEIKLGSNINIGYLSQDHEELFSERTVIDELADTGVDKTEGYKLLYRFLLKPEKINQPVNLLSSGEKSKLLLAKIMTKGSNFIILDEPTNHLDIASREAVAEAIANYPGTLLVISHDRFFLSQININKYLIINKGKLVDYSPGF